MNAAAKAKKRSSVWILGIFLLVIAAPMIAASFMINHGQSKIHYNNQGNLISGHKNITHITLHNISQDTPLPGKDLLGKWWLVYVGPQICQETCYDILYNMRQIRTALGKDASRLERLYIADNLNENYPEIKQVRINAQDFDHLFGSISDKDNRDMVGELYIIDPKGNIMMQYDVDMPPKAILSDLKRLLKVSKIG